VRPAEDKEEVDEIEVLGRVKVVDVLEMCGEFVQEETNLEIVACETCAAARVTEVRQDIVVFPVTVKCNEDSYTAPVRVLLAEDKEVVQLGSLVTQRILEFDKIFEKLCFSRMQVNFKCLLETLKMAWTLCNRIMVRKPTDDRFRPPLHDSTKLLIVGEFCMCWKSNIEEQADKYVLQSEGVEDKETNSELALKIRMKQVQQNRQDVAELRMYLATGEEEPKVAENKEIAELEDLGRKDRILLLLSQPSTVYGILPLKGSRITEDSIGQGEQAQNQRSDNMEATSAGAAGKRTGSQGVTRQEQ
jgi:hypothetical protein